jgi:hypothetical protein
MIRIITIGIYLKTAGDSYEKFVFTMRDLTSTSPFVFEVFALHGSSLAFNVIVIALGFTLPEGPNGWPSEYLSAYMVSGILGIGATVLFWSWFTTRWREIARYAEKAALEANQR